jgi:hypothetical protein
MKLYIKKKSTGRVTTVETKVEIEKDKFQRSKEYCSVCSGPRLPNWYVPYCADPFCSGQYVVNGENVENKVSILPLPEIGYRWGEDRVKFVDANSTAGL